MDNVEHEICNNCKKEIPQSNYVMHTMHCSRNITLCKICNEPIPKLEYEKHREKCAKPKKPSPPPIALEKSIYFQKRKENEDKKAAIRREEKFKRSFIDTGFTLKESVLNGYGNTAISNPSSLNSTKEKVTPKSNTPNQEPSSNQNIQHNGAIKKETTKPPLIPRLDNSSGTKPKGSQGLLPCRYCDLELPKLDLEEHENYCGTRTDKCLECGELVMFKNKQVHLDSNHGFVKLKDEPGPRASWESTTQRSASTSNVDTGSTRRFRFTGFDYDPTPYLPAAYQPGGGLKKKDVESYKEISRRLDCKTEYIRNLLHDSASITIPLRSSGTAPRNHFNHNKGPAPQPPSRRRNPPTELVIPCEFCDTPIPHEDLIQHETGCRPDLARFNPRRSRSSITTSSALDDDDYFVAPPPHRSNSPDDEELPCEFCANMVPASQLWRHQMTCTAPA
ncbi:uncharacterized protein LOC143192758 isoform X1 [Rhynchophorus ferrugineus]|uniref:uncharacterized protein LOC143192758 isoform X1 n=1 Tax=Rhynchophorus ferrugineus TaxID=354439 RepID=UPI003FCD7C27